MRLPFMVSYSLAQRAPRKAYRSVPGVKHIQTQKVLEVTGTIPA